MPTANARSSPRANARGDGRAPRGRPRQPGTGAARPGRGPGPFGPGDEHDARVAVGDARRRDVERTQRCFAAGGMHGPARGSNRQREALGDEAAEVVVGPGADGHELERVDRVEHTTAGVLVGRARRREDQRERLRRRGIVVVTVRDLADTDDHGDGDAVASRHAAEPPSSTTMAPDM